MLITVTCQDCGATRDVGEETCGTVVECLECGCNLAVPPPIVAPGVIIGGFRLIRRIGKGGMGEVYLAHQISMERDVAIKILPAEMTQNEDAVARFMHEARMSARLEHPNIVTIIDAGADGGYYYIAMRHVDGENLQERLAREHHIPELEALVYGYEVLKALDFAWRHHKILHRDVKPSNVMIDDGAVKLLDMGLAKEVLVDHSLTDSNFILGTPLYMSPEQVQGAKALDFRSDVYSLGATLFHLVTGQPMFDADSAMAIMTHQLNSPTPNPVRLNEDISKGTARLLMKMTAKSPPERCRNHQELLADFERQIEYLDPGGSRIGDGILSSAIPRLPSSRQRLFKPLLVAVPVMLIILAIGFKLGRHSTPPVVAAVQDEDQTVETVTPSAPTAVDTLAVRKELAVISGLKEDHDRMKAALTRLKELLEETNKTPVQDEVKDILDELKQRFEAMAEERSFAIRRRAWGLFLVDKTDEAVDVLTHYSGAFADETQPMRIKLANQFQAKILENEKRERREKLEAIALKKRRDAAYAKMLDSVRSTVADALMQRRFDDAMRAYRSFLDRPEFTDYRRRIRQEFDGIALLAAAQQGILESFRPQIGIRTTVDLKEGRSVIIPVRIEDGRLVAEEYLQTGPNGFTKRDLQLTPIDFTIHEQAARLPKTPRSTYVTMIALLHLEAKSTDKAIHILANSELPVARVIRRKLSPSLDESWKRMAKTAKLEGKTPTEAMNALGKATFDPKTRASVRAEADAFLSRWSRTDEALGRETIARLLAVAPLQTLPDDLVVDDRPVSVDLKCLGPGGAKAYQQQRNLEKLTNLPRWVMTRKTRIPLALIPPGTFEMGSEKTATGVSFTNERPRHRVTISKPFYCGRMELTQSQWKHVVKGLPPLEKEAAVNTPVGHVTWFDARDFVKRLCHLEGVPTGTYRLPTEAEWEYACRAGASADFAGTPKELCWHYGNSATPELKDTPWDPKRWKAAGGGTKLVAQLKPNAWGLHDCHGNLLEWCEDWYGPYTIFWSMDPTGPKQGTLRLVRGGARHLQLSVCRSATRMPLPPKSRDAGIGLRIVREAPAGSPEASANR